MREREEVNPKRVEMLFGLIGGIEKHQLGELDKRLTKNSSGINSLLKHEEDFNILHSLAVKDNCVNTLPIIEKYLDYSLYNELDSKGKTPLMCSIASGKLENAKALVDSQTRQLKKLGKTDKEIKEEIAKTINTPNHQGSYPLHVAAYDHEPSLIKFLLSQGANPQILDNNHHTPVVVAAKEIDGDKEMIKTIASLVKNSKELNTLAENGKTVLDIIRDTLSTTWGKNMEKELIRKCNHGKSGFSLWR